MFFYPNLAAAYATTRDGEQVTIRILFRDVVASLRQARAERRATRARSASPASPRCA